MRQVCINTSSVSGGTGITIYLEDSQACVRACVHYRHLQTTGWSTKIVHASLLVGNRTKYRATLVTRGAWHSLIMSSGQLQVLAQLTRMIWCPQHQHIKHSNTHHDNAQVMIDHRVNQAAAQVLLQILLLTAASIGQLWLREIAMSLDFCLLSLPYCLCYSLTHLSWHPVDLGLDTIDTDWVLSPLLARSAGGI